MAIVAEGFFSMIQWPDPGMMPAVTSLAAARITTAMVGPNDPAADRQHRHRQLAAGRKDGAIIDRVLIEGRELREARMHRSGQRVAFGIMLARGFGEMRRRCGIGQPWRMAASVVRRAS